MNKIKSNFTAVLHVLLSLIILTIMMFAVKVQFVVPISFVFLLYDFLLFLFIVVPAFIPDKYMTRMFVKFINNEKITNAILITVAFIIDLIYWDKLLYSN